MTEAERRVGQRTSVRRGADALADLRVRLAERDGVPATIYRAVSSRRWVLVATYWMMRWTGPTYHIALTPAGHRDRNADQLMVEIGRAHYFDSYSKPGSSGSSKSKSSSAGHGPRAVRRGS